MANALSFSSHNIQGIALPWQLPTHETHQATTKFFAVKGESRIDGEHAGRSLEIPVLVYSAQFNTQAKLSGYLREMDLALRGFSATLVVHSSVDHPPFTDCVFDGFQIVEEPKIDAAGSLGGGAFAVVLFLFRQLS
jgi:hypothetical protein